MGFRICPLRHVVDSYSPLNLQMELSRGILAITFMLNVRHLVASVHCSAYSLLQRRTDVHPVKQARARLESRMGSCRKRGTISRT